jgi:4-amino-4-deoxy-L-arabinose transferase-like glycosyltransferase
VFLSLGLHALRQSAATWDEPIHLTAGYAAWTRQDFRVDPSHPPLVRMWASLPVAAGAASIDTRPVDALPAEPWLPQAYEFAHRFLYRDHDADQLLYRARFMVLLLGVALGAALFFWIRSWLGFAPAVFALGLYTVEPNLAAHASLVTTDFGATCFIFLTVYGCWQLHRRPSWPRVAAVAFCSAAAVVTKFSGLLLGPIVVLLLAVSVYRGGLSARRAMVAVAVVAMTTFGAIWAVYGFRYLPSETPAWVFALDGGPAAEASAGARVAGWLDAHRILPNAFTQGVRYAQTSSVAMPGYLAGEVRTGGWWYYFPAAALLKTPVTVLLFVVVGAAALLRARSQAERTTQVFVLVPPLVFAGVAAASGVNIGLRHILPVYPFALLLAAAGGSALLRLHRRSAVVVLAVSVLVASVELASAYPHPLTFFNVAAGGPANGFRYLADSNLAWGQGLKPVKAWMERRQVAHINLAYFGQADPGYYGIDCTHLPGAPSFALDAIARPRLPGYVAISATTLSGVYEAPEWRLFYRPFAELEPAAVIANGIRVYWVEEWPLPSDEDVRAAAAGARRRLADALLFGLQWPEQATRAYRQHLLLTPDDTDARVNAGIALVAAGQVGAGVQALHDAAADEGHVRAQLTLARALFGRGDLAGAVRYGDRALALSPDDAETLHFRGRLWAASGDFIRARDAFVRALHDNPGHNDARRDLDRLQQSRPWPPARGVLP